MRCRRRSALGSLLTATILLMSGSSALAQQGSADDPGTQAKTTPGDRRSREDIATRPLRRRRRLRRGRRRRSGQRRQAGDRRRRRRRRARRQTDERRPTSRSRWPASTAASPPSRPTRRCPPTRTRPPTGAVKSDNIEWVSNSRGLSNQVANPNNANGNYAGATFMHFENLGYDFLLGDGTGGLSIWSLKNPEQPQFVSGVTSKQLEQPAGHVGNRDVPADTPTAASTRVRTRPSTRAASSPSWPATRARSATTATRAAAPASTSSTSRTRGTRRSSPTTGSRPATPRPASTTAATCGASARPTTARGVNGQPQDVAGVLHPGVDRRPGLRDRRARPAAPVHVREAGRHEAQQQHDRLHALASTSTRTASPGPPASAASAATTPTACTSTR